MNNLKGHFSTLVIVNRSSVWDGAVRLGSIKKNYNDVINCITQNGRILWHNDDMIPVGDTSQKLALIEKTIRGYIVN